MEKFIVGGGFRLKGSIIPAGNKNAVLPILAATLLTDETVTLYNIPRIIDVEIMVKLMQSIGSRVVWRNNNTLTIQTDLPSEKTIYLNKKYACEIRASILFAGPLLARGWIHIFIHWSPLALRCIPIQEVFLSNPGNLKAQHFFSMSRA